MCQVRCSYALPGMCPPLWLVGQNGCNSAHLMLCEKRVRAPEGSAAVQKDVLNLVSKTELEVFSSLCFSSLSASSAAEQVSAGSQLKGEKRKASEEEEKNGREELVEKKVCKGFQTV